MYIGPSHPSDQLLSTAAPLKVWEVAKKQAARSPMVKFKCGAVIWDGNEVVSSGTSHPDISHSKVFASVHAERHALKHYIDVDDCWCVIYTVNSRGGSAWSSRPCYSCAKKLCDRGISRVIYPERLSDRWIVLSEHPEALLNRETGDRGLFARNMRIPPLTPIKSSI